MRFSHQESVPVEGCDRRRWPGLQRVVRDLQRGPSEQAPAKRHSALGRLTALTCRDAFPARPWTANPGEKTSMCRLTATRRMQRQEHFEYRRSMHALRYRARLRLVLQRLRQVISASPNIGDGRRRSVDLFRTNEVFSTDWSFESGQDKRGGCDCADPLRTQADQVKDLQRVSSRAMPRSPGARRQLMSSLRAALSECRRRPLVGVAMPAPAPS
jgi:hypothetical protein